MAQIVRKKETMNILINIPINIDVFIVVVDDDFTINNTLILLHRIINITIKGIL